MVNPILDQFESTLKRDGKDIIVNDSNIFKGILREIEDSATNDIKYVYMPLYTLEQGYKLSILDKDWLCTKKDINSNEVYEKGIIELCNETINFNFDGEIVQLNAIVHIANRDVVHKRLFSLYNDKLTVTLKDSPQSRRIYLKQRIICQNSAWEITGRDYTKKGLITLHCEIDLFSAYDDIENEIPNIWEYETKHQYVLTIEDGGIINTIIGNQYQLTTKLGDFLEEVFPLPELVYTSSDDTIATVDSNGVVTSLSVGSTIIKVQMANNMEIEATTLVRVEESPLEDKYEITITSTSDKLDVIRVDCSVTFSANVTNNGQKVNDKTVSWVYSNATSSNNNCVNEVSRTGTTLSMDVIDNYNNIGEKMNIKAALDSDNNVYDELVVMINGLW